jgi:phospholipase/carboxylesterase
MSKIDYIELQTGIDPAWTVIWLHGLGADGHDFEPVAAQLGFSDSPAIRFIFPHAPIRPITINGGMEMRGWYDVRGMAFDRDQDRSGLEDSAAIVGSLIEQENRRGIDTSHIILAGFSQGGAVALFAGLRLEQKLAGIIALSTYLADAASTESERSQQNLDVPIFLAHGTDDPVIPLALAEQSRTILEQLNYTVHWHRYQMPHSVSAGEIQHIAEFMAGIVE